MAARLDPARSVQLRRNYGFFGRGNPLEVHAVGRIAIIIAVSYGVACVLAIIFMVRVAVSTRRPERVDEAELHTLAEGEKTWFAITVVLLAALLFATIFFTPYGRSAGKNAQVVNVRAVQFAWLVSGSSIKAGRQVEFHLTSADVNHGFAVYTAGGKLLFEVQVMPDKTQDYVYTFQKPGTYTILCIEYCGVGHAHMQGQLTVTA
jgi:cytochrome c oxidase subunit II